MGSKYHHGKALGSANMDLDQCAAQVGMFGGQLGLVAAEDYSSTELAAKDVLGRHSRPFRQALHSDCRCTTSNQS